MKKLSLFLLTFILFSCSNNEEENNTPNVSIPEVTTMSIYFIGLSSAGSGGNFISDGGSRITQGGLVWNTSPNPTTALTTKTINNYGEGTAVVGNDFTNTMTGLSANTIYYVRAYATNSIGTAYGNEISFTTNSIQLPSLSTISVEDTTNSTALAVGNISSDGGGSISVRGVVWSTSDNPTIALPTKTIDGSGLGTFNSNLTGLSENTTYYVRAYATNSAGTSYGNTRIFRKQPSYPSGTVFCNGWTQIVDVINPSTGKTWMDRNLGASRRGIEPPGMTDSQAYGDLYQWGRRADGHQCRNSTTTTTLSSTDQPSHGSFIINPDINITNFDWRSSPNNNLWQSVNGINNPCPNGYRIPTASELDSEIMRWGPGSSTQPNSFTSPLNWTRGGSRATTGAVVGTFGFYWSSTLIGSGSFYTSPSILFFQSNRVKSIQDDDRGRGLSVRCIKN
ncbi:hypothetical protein [Flavobacterium sp.]|uniref:hypothetical protein n=1 Tax=Flavobacterium sp. TaxID=239 RepID=UPI0037C03121